MMEVLLDEVAAAAERGTEDAEQEDKDKATRGSPIRGRTLSPHELLPP